MPLTSLAVRGAYEELGVNCILPAQPTSAGESSSQTRQETTCLVTCPSSMSGNSGRVRPMSATRTDEPWTATLAP
eukprot:CAMPEP_0194512998 /NCGR_PEP_ID=MMETSP0253-20130528/45163_1 /TAXON_ID=2966 /ORGANISM="Noctiluca scintillans" /LENGTH=74 /DNA_ID=CAMNT_0039356511 /DNA_START=1114 /DNA_END=1338 /DNA_ORIENTATION=+